MLYPSLQELTNEKVNRYRLVIATSKCARHITEKRCEEKEIAEQRKEIDRFAKDARTETIEDTEKAVSLAIDRLKSGEYKIITD